MALTNDAENALLDAILSNTAWGTLLAAGALANVWFALHTADPTDTGSVANECDYTGYARVQMTRATAFNAASGGSKNNSAVIAFPQKTGGADDAATHFSIHTASTGAGNMIVHAPLSATLTISDGVAPEFAASQMTVTAS